ncbi:MAG TPA: hypothetical protein VMS98_14115 [Thermoanaerobaculia bacterium]|nr:hypothetical protein [Thermoanaerobaculia bacterium]
MRRTTLLLLFLVVPPAFAQTAADISFQRTFLLRNAAGTSFNPGPTPHHPLLFERGAWTAFFEGAAFATYTSETGPEEQRNELFSTNWLAAGVQWTAGRRGLLLLRGRVSLEPYTIPDQGYPQILQFVSAGSGGPLLDSMRPHDLVGEAAAHFAFRTSNASFLHLYAAPVGTPALGPVPYAQRSSSEEFAEAPFAYDVQETMLDSTSVVTAGFASRWISLEGSVFHDAVTESPHTTIESGDIDSRSARLTLTPGRNLAIQVSRGELGDDEREITTASLTWAGSAASLSLIYTDRDDLDSGGAETTFRFGRSTFMLRAETVDRPPGFLDEPDVKRTSHFTIGYIYDFIARNGIRTGIGFNFDYHTQTHDIEDIYGHKPQTLYLFGRIRTDALRR